MSASRYDNAPAGSVPHFLDPPRRSFARREVASTAIEPCVIVLRMRALLGIGGAAVLMLAIGCGDKKANDDDKDPEAETGETPAPVPVPIEPATPMPDLPEDSGEHGAAHAWSARFGGTGSDAPRDVATGPEGRIAITGFFSETLDLGTGPMESAGKTDAFVAVLDAGGKVQWTQRLGGAHEDAGNAVTFDGNGNVIVVGQFGESLTVGDKTMVSNGSDDVFVVAFSPAGEPRWGRAYGSNDTDEGNAVVADATGNLFVGGGFRQPVTVGEITLETAGGYDAFVIALGGDGQPRWARSWGDRGDDRIRALTIDPQGSLVAALEFAGTLQAVPAGSVTTRGNTDLAALKLDTAGTPVWITAFGGGYSDLATGIASDGAGNIMISGGFDRELTVEGEKLEGKGDTDAFVLSLGPDGARRWVRVFGGAGKDVAQDVAADPFGNVVVTGHFHDEVAFGETKLASKGNRDVFLLKLSPDAEVRWARAFGDKDHDQGATVAMDAAGNPALAGVFRFQIGFGGEPLEAAHEADDKVPFADIFVVSYQRSAE